MDEITHLLVLVGLAGFAVTVLAGFARWYNDEGRRVRRGLKVILHGDTHGLLVARGRGRGVGFNFTSNQVAVAWDGGAWGLVYSLDELDGAEVIVDGHVVGRIRRGEPRRGVDILGGAELRVGQARRPMTVVAPALADNLGRIDLPGFRNDAAGNDSQAADEDEWQDDKVADESAR